MQLSWSGRVVRALMLVAAGLCLSACGGANPFGKSSPFSQSSDVDRLFIGAAQTWDFDKNGAVTCDEWKQYAAESFRAADGNGDSALDAQEFPKMAVSDRLFQEANHGYYDANSDGKVSVDELTGKQNAAFRLLDKNGDCQIDRNETVTVLQSNAPKPKAAETPDGPPRGGI